MRLDPLGRYLREADGDRVVLSFEQIESIIGGPLPASARYPAFWSGSSYYARGWTAAGFRSTSRNVPPGHRAFVRDPAVASAEAGKGAIVPDPVTRRAESTGVAVPRGSGIASRVILIGCVKTKGSGPAPAGELFTSALFVRRRAYAEASGGRWFVLSAKDGLLDPAEVVGPYDVYLGQQPAEYRRVWGLWVAEQLQRELGGVGDRTFEVHAGQSYVAPLRAPLAALGAEVVAPLEHLRRGEQLAWYGGDLAPGGPLMPDAGPSDPVGQGSDGPPLSVDVRPLDPFAYRWPDSEETFDAGWEAIVWHDGRRRVVRHGLAGRQVYGRFRRPSVTWLDGAPTVEGVAADDYETSGGLVSPLKATDKTLVRCVVDAPGPYRSLPLVDHRVEIDAPYSRDAAAVKLAEDDVLGWATYALARAEVIAGRVASPRPVAASPLATPVTPPAPAAVTGEGVVAALLAYGASTTGTAGVPAGPPSFTPVPDANDLVIGDPFAFLLAVIFDQNVPAERAWRAPYDLRQRLGHLDPHRIAVEEHAVRVAVNQPPKLHRYVEKLPRWVSAAAVRVVTEYGGDAGRIWGDRPSARRLLQRLGQFDGIGQKKAAMAVEILERDLGVPVTDMHGSDIAYDVHVRRVFLRTGLAQYDELDHMLQVARAANPARPGAIDNPAWLVGRQWCRAGCPTARPAS